MLTLTFLTHTVEETERLGKRVGQHLIAGDVICLQGTLGAGKTALTRGLAAGWGAVDPVTSPTFTLMNVYQRERDTLRFYHIDGYRLSGEVDAWSAGLEDALDDSGVVVVEWPERIGRLLPADRLWIEITDQGQDQRELTVTGKGTRSETLVTCLQP